MMVAYKKWFPLFLFILFFASACDRPEEKSASGSHDSVLISTDSLVVDQEEAIDLADDTDKDPLPSWNNTKTKQAIIHFVEAATTQGSKSYVEPSDRIATFDNDGTLWAEKPTYFQIEFVLFRIKQLAPQHPEWKKDKLIQAALQHDLEFLRKKSGVKGMERLVAYAQAGITTDKFEKIVRNWINKARHPLTGKRYINMVYKPMLELISYLQANEFKVYIVSGGGVDFMRVWAEEAYDIPRENILGSIGKLNYEKINGKPVLIKSNEMLFVNDGAGKPMSIHQFIGKKPLIAFGNSDGDLQMLEWCSSNNYKTLSAFIHHTDAKREWAYDRNSRIGMLNKGLDEATERGWLLVDMKKDWRVIYP